MKKILLFALFIFIYSFAFSQSAPDLSDRIVIDGYSSDFQPEERLLIDPLPNCPTPLESDNDSKWGIYNDVRGIDVTWDANYLYVAVDACSWDNNTILFIDIYDDYGIRNMLDLNTWKRAFKFYNSNPDFFLATWDTNTSPQFWKMQTGSETQADQLTIEAYSSLNTGKLDRSMEAKIPWNILYPQENMQDAIKNNPTIKFIAVITSGSDYKSGPDVAPDNLGGMPSDANKSVVLDNYVQINIDPDGNGIPDFGVQPAYNTVFYKRPPIKPTTLKIEKVNFPNGKVFSPYRQSLVFNIQTNRISPFHTKIYDINGKYIGKAKSIEGEDLSWKWDGKDKTGKIVSSGVYIILIYSDSGETSEKRAITVIK